MVRSPLSREERLTKYFHRLGAQPVSPNAKEALDRVIRTLDDVEDAYSGVPKSEPPPPIGQSDGRMYPPRGDRVTLLHNGGIRAQTKGHDIAIGAAAASRSRTARPNKLNSNNLEEESDMPLTEDVARLADEIRQGAVDVSTEITTFPSGAVSLLARVGGRAFELVYLPSYAKFAVDELEGDAGFDSGYRFGFQDFASARIKLLDMLEKARAALVHD